MKINCITAVWGEEYTSFFTRTVLPSLLWPGNLPAVAANRETAYLIYTTESDRRRIAASDTGARLAALLPVEFIEIERFSPGSGDKYALAADCHKLAVARSHADGAAMMLLSPDCIYSDGSFARALHLLVSGKRAVMSGSLRAAKETFVPALAAEFGEPYARRPLTGRELLGVALRHLHPIIRAQRADSPVFSRWPSHIYWPLGADGKDGMAARCFHLHPLLINPVFAHSDFNAAMDNDYLIRACPDPGQIGIIEDSDELLGIEISAGNQFDHMISANTYSPSEIAAWAMQNANEQHRDFFNTTICFHATDRSVATERALAEVERQAKDIAGRLGKLGQQQNSSHCK